MNLQEILGKLNNGIPPSESLILQIVFFIFVMYLILLIIWISFYYSTRRRPGERIAKLDQKINEAETEAEQNPESNRAIWEVNYYQLVRFIEINREQNSKVFRLSIWMILFGLLLICGGLARDFLYVPSVQTSAASWAAIIAGLVTQFIAATILVLFRSVVQQTMEYFKTVERMASIGVAINILDNLPTGENTENLKMKTLSEIAIKVIELGLTSQDLKNETPMAIAKSL